MTQKVIANVKGRVPTKLLVDAIDDNFDELYALTDGTGTALNLTEYANNTAAVAGGLSVGDLYTTTGTVKVVTA